MRGGNGIDEDMISERDQTVNLGSPCLSERDGDMKIEGLQTMRLGLHIYVKGMK